ncbi:hypothetical protein DFH28DRAFT_959700 [Melampsora americana]|nr:hypothetical protein DFH28DRAFT_959700 [Melampsora americana]
MNEMSFKVCLIFLFAIFDQSLCRPSPSLQYISKIHNSDVHDFVSDALLGPNYLISSSSKKSMVVGNDKYLRETPEKELATCFSSENPPPGFENSKLKEVVNHSDSSNLNAKGCIHTSLAPNSMISNYRKNNNKTACMSLQHHAPKGFQKAIQPPKSFHSGSRKDIYSQRSDISEMGSTLSPSNSIYNLQDNNHFGMFQPVPETQSERIQGPVGNTKAKESSVHSHYPVYSGDQIMHTTPDKGFIVNDGLASQYNCAPLSRIEWTHHGFQKLKNHGPHIWNQPQTQAPWPNHHTYQSFEPLKAQLSTPLSFELFEESLFQSHMKNNFPPNQDGIYKFFPVLHRRLTKITTEGNWDYWGMPPDLKVFAVYAVKAQLSAWMISSKPGSPLYKAIYLNKNKINLRGLETDETYSFKRIMRHFEMALNKSLKQWRDFIVNKKPSKDHIFYGLVNSFHKTQEEVNTRIKRRLAGSNDDWYIPVELTNYVAFATKESQVSPVVKEELKYWMSLCGDKSPISMMCGYALSWLERQEIFIHKDYKMDVDKAVNKPNLLELFELDYRKGLDTALEYWEDLMHYALGHAKNNKFAKEIKGKFENDHMEKRFATYVASAFKIPNVFNRIKENLEFWMASTEKGSAINFKAQVAAEWLHEKETAGLLHLH